MAEIRSQLRELQSDISDGDRASVRVAAKLARSESAREKLEKEVRRYNDQIEKSLIANQEQQVTIDGLEANLTELRRQITLQAQGQRRNLSASAREAQIRARETMRAADRRFQKKMDRELRNVTKLSHLRRVKANSTAKSIQKYKNRWADDVHFHMKSRKKMSESQILGAVETLFERMKLDCDDESDIAEDEKKQEDVVTPVPTSTMDDVARAKATRAKSKLMENFESQEALDKAVSEYIRPMHRFRRLAPAVCASQLKQEGAESFSKSLHDYLSPQRCLFVKQQTNLSKDQWHKVRNLLTKRYDTDTARHLPLILDGTLVHPLPGVWRLDKERDLQLEGLTVRESDDGAFAAVVVADKMRLDILNHLNLGHLRRENGVIVGSDGQHPVVCWSFDACGIFNGMKQTSFGYKICNLINCVENSPKYFHEFALMECGDDHAQIVTHAQSTMDEVNVIIDAKSVADIPIINVGCADQAALHSNFGEGGCDQGFPCSYCKVPKAKVSCTNKKELEKGWDARTLQNSAELAHTVLGSTCPGCEMEIVLGDHKVDGKLHKYDRETERPVAKLLDKPPPAPELYRSVPHSITHHNQKPGQSAIIKLAPELWCICVLHMHLRIVNNLFERSVLHDSTLGIKPKGSNDKQSLAYQIWTMLTAAGIRCKLMKSPKQDVNQYWHSVSRHSFMGRDVATLLSIWKPLMKLVYSKESRKDPAEQVKYERFCKVWDAWNTEVWPLVYKIPTDENWTKEDKASELEVAGLKWLKLWKTATGGTNDLYPHLLVSHFPDQVRNMPVDPWYLQTQSLENRHSWRKKWSFKTNKHCPKDLADRKKYVEDYWRDGKLVKGYAGSTGICRNTQILIHTLLNDKLQDIFETSTSRAILFKKADERRRRRHANQVRAKEGLAVKAEAATTKATQRANAIRQLATMDLSIPDATAQLTRTIEHNRNSQANILLQLNTLADTLDESEEEHIENPDQSASEVDIELDHIDTPSPTDSESSDVGDT